MSLPTQADLFTLKYAGLDGVHCDVAPSPSVNTASMAYALFGEVFFSPTGSVAGTPDGSNTQMYSVT
jgi:hypothetical protein